MLKINISSPHVERQIRELATINHMDNDEFVTNCLAMHLGMPEAQARFSMPDYVDDKQPMYADL